MQYTRVKFGVGILLTFTLALAGCAEDHPTTPTAAPRFPFPDSRYQVMQNFRHAYHDHNISAYRDVLHPMYRFFFHEYDISRLGLQTIYFDRDAELGAAANMFSGEILSDPTGGNDHTPAITDIDVHRLDQITAWEPSTHPSFPGTEQAEFEIQLSATRHGSNSFVITSRQTYFITNRDSLHDNGQIEQFFQIAGQVDMMPGCKGCEYTSWGELKHLYRSQEPLYTFPDTEDKAVTNLRLAYGQMDIDQYRSVFHPDYSFYFTQEDIYTLGLISDHWDLSEEMAATTHMFSGESRPDPFGGSDIVPGISRIDFVLLQRFPPWRPSDNPAFPDSRWATFDIELRFYRPGYNTVVIAGEQDFYVARRDSVRPGQSSHDYWQIVGQVDRGSSMPKGSDSTSWGSLKVLYR